MKLEFSQREKKKNAILSLIRIYRLCITIAADIPNLGRNPRLFAATTFKWQPSNLKVITKYNQILAQFPKMPVILELTEISQV